MSKDESQFITAFIPVFQGKVDKMKERLKKELEKSKSERTKSVIKDLIREIKRLQKTIKHAGVSEKKCPHCGGKL